MLAGRQAHPVPAGDLGWEVTAQLVAVQVERGLIAAVVGRSPNEVQARVHITGVRRVEDHRDVEGLRLRLEQWIIDHVPPWLTVAVEVHVGRRFKVVVETDVRIGSADTRLAAVSENGNEPVAAAEGVGAVVLRAA